MTPLVPSIVEVLMNKIVLWISKRGNDWTAESAMISSNDVLVLKGYDTRMLVPVWFWGPHAWMLKCKKITIPECWMDTHHHLQPTLSHDVVNVLHLNI